MKEYKILKESNDSYERCKSLITIARNDFGDDDILYLDSPIDSAKNEIFKCINEISEYVAWLNHITKEDKPYHFYRMSVFFDTDDDFYKDLIDYGGFHQVLHYGDDILNAETIVLDNTTEEHLIHSFTIEKEHKAYIIMLDFIEAIKNDYLNEYNDDINEIINKYWDNTISFDYYEWEMNQQC